MITHPQLGRIIKTIRPNASPADFIVQQDAAHPVPTLIKNLTVNPVTQAEVDAAVVPSPADLEYDRRIKSDRLLVALILALNDGSLVPGARNTPAQIKNIIKAKL